MTEHNGEITRPNRIGRRKLIRNIVIGLVGLTICGGIGFFGLMMVLGYALSGLNFNYPKCTVSNPAGIENVAKFKFPPSAKLLSAGCGGMQGWAAWASFEMNPADLDTFLATTSVKQPLSNTNRPEKISCFCDNPEKITDYLYGEYRSFKWDEEVFIDTHDKNLYTVYFTVLGG